MKGLRINLKNHDEIKNQIAYEKSASAKNKLLFLNIAADSDLDFEKICQLCGIALSTGYQLVRGWDENGYESVKDKKNKGGRPPKLSKDDLQQLRRFLEKKKNWKTRDVQNLIKEKFGVDLSEDQVSRIMKHKLGLHDPKKNDEESSAKNDYPGIDAIIINDIEDRITAWSPGAEQMFGWTSQEALGKRPAELIVPPEMLPERELIVNTAMTGRSITGIDTQRRHKDGTIINVSMAVYPLRDTKQNIIGISYIIRDITEHKRAEIVLQREHDKLNIWVRELTSELSLVNKNLQAEIEGHKHAEEAVQTSLKLWQDTFNAISDGLWLLARDGHIIMSNRATERILGRDEKNVSGLHCYKIAHNSSDFMEKCPFQKMLETGRHEFVEYEDKERGQWFQISVDPIYD